MHPEMEMLRCAIVRGGTSKAVFVMKNEYPEDPAKRDAVILAVYGSPDVRQIDGLGGADVLTSQLPIISRPTRTRPARVSMSHAANSEPRPHASSGLSKSQIWTL